MTLSGDTLSSVWSLDRFGTLASWIATQRWARLSTIWASPRTCICQHLSVIAFSFVVDVFTLLSLAFSSCTGLGYISVPRFEEFVPALACDLGPALLATCSRTGESTEYLGTLKGQTSLPPSQFSNLQSPLVSMSSVFLISMWMIIPLLDGAPSKKAKKRHFSLPFAFGTSKKCWTYEWHQFTLWNMLGIQC